MQTHKFPFHIAYADTDAGGIVYHARYVEIAERARMQIFEAANDPSCGFVVRSLGVRFMKPLLLNDHIIVESQITGHGAATLDIEQKFTKDGEIKAVLKCTIACIGADMRPVRLSRAWLDLAEQED